MHNSRPWTKETLFPQLVSKSKLDDPTGTPATLNEHFLRRSTEEIE